MLAFVGSVPILTRYDYNLTIMESPKPATDNRLKNKSKAIFEIEQCWICVVLWWPFWKWQPVEIFRCQESIRDIIIYPNMKCRWNRTMLNLCGIVMAILKMATARNFLMSGIYSGHHNLLTYEMSLKSNNVEFVWYCGSHFENGNR